MPKAPMMMIVLLELLISVVCCAICVCCIYIRAGFFVSSVTKGGFSGVSSGIKWIQCSTFTSPSCKILTICFAIEVNVFTTYIAYNNDDHSRNDIGGS